MVNGQSSKIYNDFCVLLSIDQLTIVILRLIVSYHFYTTAFGFFIAFPNNLVSNSTETERTELKQNPRIVNLKK